EVQALGHEASEIFQARRAWTMRRAIRKNDPEYPKKFVANLATMLESLESLEKTFDSLGQFSKLAFQKKRAFIIQYRISRSNPHFPENLRLALQHWHGLLDFLPDRLDE